MTGMMLLLLFLVDILIVVTGKTQNFFVTYVIGLRLFIWIQLAINRALVYVEWCRGAEKATSHYLDQWSSDENHRHDNCLKE